MKIVAGLLFAAVAFLVIWICWKNVPVESGSHLLSTPEMVPSSEIITAIGSTQEIVLPDPSNAIMPQERRLFEFLADTRDRGFDDLVSNLKVNNDAYGMLLTDGQRGDFGPFVPLVAAFGDRRICKLYELLQEMAPDQASDRIAAAFDAEFAIYCQRWEDSRFKAGAFHENKYGLGLLLLLCSEFCEEPILLEMIDDWHRWHAQNLNKGKPPTPGKAEYLFCNTGGPDELLVANLYMNCLIKKGAVIEELNLELDAMGRDMGLTGFPELRNRKLHRWFLFKEEQYEQPESLLAVIPVFETWNPAIRFSCDVEVQDAVLSELRSWVDEERNPDP